MPTDCSCQALLVIGGGHSPPYEAGGQSPPYEAARRRRRRCLRDRGFCVLKPSSSGVIFSSVTGESLAALTMG